MNRLFFEPVLKAFSEGRVLRAVTAGLLRTLSLLGVIGGLYLFFKALEMAFREGLPLEWSLAAITVSLFLPVVTAVVAQIQWLRATSILELEDGPYTAIPIVSLLVRCAGEVYAVVLVAMGLGGCGVIWMVGRFPGSMMGPLAVMMPSMQFYSDNQFLAGLFLLGSMLLLAFIVVMGCYFLAESLVVLTDIARSTKNQAAAFPGALGQLATVLQGSPARQVPRSSSSSEAILPVLRVPGPKGETCSQCGVLMEPGAGFCGNCGSKK